MLDDLNFDGLSIFCDVRVYDETPAGKIIERMKGADIVLTNKTPIDRAAIDGCPKLKYISVLATGYNVVDAEYAAEKGIPVSNVPAYSSDSVAQHAFALLLSATNRVSEHVAFAKRNKWAQSGQFSACLAKIPELKGKTLGIVGYGDIGKKVAEIARAFGMRAVACRRRPDPDCVSREELFRISDVISLHCPLTAETKGMIDEAAIREMKQGVTIVNTARGGLIDEKAVLKGLESGKIGRYLADVTMLEPPEPNDRLVKHRNAMITPHIAWATFEARKRLIAQTVENVRAFASGEPINVVNGVRKGT